MKIQLITPEQHENLLNIYKNYPALTLQNKGYEGINKDKLTDEEKGKIKEVEAVLNNHICGFSRFQNFKLSNDNEVKLRFQYNYDYDSKNNTGFTGVGYILLDELLNGFRD